MTYELIAFDMDGTLLDSSKKVLPSSIEAMREATEAGKVVAICSGRCPTMVTMHADDLAHVRYAICGSGAVLYDLREDEVLFESSLDHDLVARAVAACEGEDVMPEVFSGRGFFYQASHLPQMDRYHMGIYAPMYAAVGTPVEDIRATLLDPEGRYQKFNLHFATADARDRVRARLAGLPLEVADSETTSLELSPVGVNKGTGLLALADRLGIDRAATIGVGDADNDLAMLRDAGLGVAMGNANDNARAAADVSVADNDHDGCAEAVRRFLLGTAGAR